MGRLHLQAWRTSAGEIATYASEVQDAHRPLVALLHGAFRRSEALFDWADRLADLADTLFLDLPGHGRSADEGPTTVAGMATAVQEVLEAAAPTRRILLVGESFGGAVALAVAGADAPPQVRAVLAADPPMTTAKLWKLAEVSRAIAARSPADGFVARFVRDAFGLTADGTDERIYYPLVGALTRPAAILTGDVPLLPPRPLRGVACLFDAVDQFVVQELYPARVEIVQAPNCGHVVLSEAPEACRAIVERLLAGPGFAAEA